MFSDIEGDMPSITVRIMLEIWSQNHRLPRQQINFVFMVIHFSFLLYTDCFGLWQPINIYETI